MNWIGLGSPSEPPLELTLWELTYWKFYWPARYSHLQWNLHPPVVCPAPLRVHGCQVMLHCIHVLLGFQCCPEGSTRICIVLSSEHSFHVLFLTLAPSREKKHSLGRSKETVNNIMSDPEGCRHWACIQSRARAPWAAWSNPTWVTYKLSRGLFWGLKELRHVKSFK